LHNGFGIKLSSPDHVGDDDPTVDEVESGLMMRATKKTWPVQGPLERHAERP